MTFTSVPALFSPIGAPLLYTLADADAAGTELHILDADGGRLGTKRIVGRTDPTVDIALYLRAVLRFDPSEGPTGALPAADRTVTVRVEAETASEACCTDLRTYVAGDRPLAASALLTTLPPNRLIAPDGFDELTLFASVPLQVIVTAHRRDGTEQRFYPLATRGLWRFRLAAADFPDAERLTVDAGPCGTLRYTVLPPPDGARTLAWRTRAGSVERYTFPVVQRVTRSVTRLRGRDAAGTVCGEARTEERILLQAAVEPNDVAAALAELPAACEVWLTGGGEARPVDVVTESADLYRHACRCAPLFEIRSISPDRPLWSC